MCRERIMEALRSDEDSKELLEKNEEKNQRFRARQAEDAEREEKKRKLDESRLAKATSYVPAEEVPPVQSSSSNPSSSSKRGPDIVEHIDRIVRTKFPEQRGEKRLEDTGAEREVRARIREARGQKRVPEDDGRTNLDEAGLEMVRNAAEAGLALARKAVRVDAVSNKFVLPVAPPTHSYAPQPAQMTYATH